MVDDGSTLRSTETDSSEGTATPSPDLASESNLTAAHAHGQLIEVGVIVTGVFDRVDRLAARQAIEVVQEQLREHFPELHFEFSTLRRPEFVPQGRVEPSRLLQQAVEDRNSHHWDFAIVLTAAEIVGVYSSYCFAALSRPTDAAVISTSLIDPQVVGLGMDEAERVQSIAWRLSRLMLHALGHLSGLNEDSESENLMFHPDGAEKLDRMVAFRKEQVERARGSLYEVADQRLEESSSRSIPYPLFAVKAAWINRREIADAVLAARPWQLPGRLSGLSIASVSTLAILLMTAEAWDLGLHQSGFHVFLLAMISLIVTTVYVVFRQQLLVRRRQQKSEQTVMMSASAFGIVFLGMLVAWIGLCAIGLIISSTLFSASLIVSWAASVDLSERLSSAQRLQLTFQMSCFCASLGLLIGSLGASFESKNYFRHMIFVDEEI